MGQVILGGQDKRFIGVFHGKAPNGWGWEPNSGSLIDVGDWRMEKWSFSLVAAAGFGENAPVYLTSSELADGRSPSRGDRLKAQMNGRNVFVGGA